MPELSVVVPTFNERENLAPLVAAIESALTGIDFEVIIVDDDSPDGTSAAARSLAQSNPRVRSVQRVYRSGLASAVIEGMLASSAPYLAVIDGDLQHDERILPEMLRRLQHEELDLVIGSRHVDGGGMGEFARSRVLLSELGRRLARWLTRVEVSDPMSGFFALRRSFLDEVVHRLSGTGFKILVDLLASSPRAVKVGEVGYVFRNRARGESKLDIVVNVEYLQLLLDKALGGLVPPAFLLFGLVGLFGVGVNVALVFLLMGAGRPFQEAVTVSTACVIAVNYFLNNSYTFRQRRLRGVRMWRGLALFYLGCSLGLFVNVRIAQGLSRDGLPLALAAGAGISVSWIWNYWITSLLVWRVNRAR
jgi:dolichol-phosphate mannosyltransferase